MTLQYPIFNRQLYRKYLEDITRLRRCGIEPAHPESELSSYLYQKLMGFGYKAQFQKFEYSGEQVCNIIGTRNKSPKYCVICAHSDTKIDNQGAIDNVSGMTALLEIARNTQSENILFVLTCLEELGQIGARHLLEYIGREAITVVVNLDSVGDNRLFTWVTQDLHEAFRNWEPLSFKELAHRDYDATVFAEAGIPTIHIGGTGSSNIYHTPQDTLDRVSLRNIYNSVGMALDT